MKLLLYCTKNKKKLFYDVISQNYMYGEDGKNDKFNSINGKIVAECDYEVEEIKAIERWDYSNTFYSTRYLNEGELLEESCLTYEELDNYLKGKNGYAIHIKNLNIFDKPRELNCYFLEGKPVKFRDDLKLSTAKAIKQTPQNMCYVRGCNTGEKYILISIRPEWVCKILNGEKTIEIRKKVLKEMLK